jgi:hypothetical protein
MDELDLVINMMMVMYINLTIVHGINLIRMVYWELLVLMLVMMMGSLTSMMRMMWLLAVMMVLRLPLLWLSHLYVMVMITIAKSIQSR